MGSQRGTDPASLSCPGYDGDVDLTREKWSRDAGICRAERKMRIPKITPHSSRRTFISIALRANQFDEE